MGEAVVKTVGDTTGLRCALVGEHGLREDRRGQVGRCACAVGLMPCSCEPLHHGLLGT